MTEINKNKAFLFALLLSGVVISTSAQYSGGVIAGANFSNLNGSSVKNNKGLTGLSAGILANYSTQELFSGKFGEIFSIQAEIHLDQIGATMSFPIDSLANDTLLLTDSILVDRKLAFSYLKVPILVKFNFGNPQGFNYFGELGLYGAGLFGLTVDGEKKRDHDEKSYTDPRNYRDEFEGFEYGAVIGAGISMPFSGRNNPWRIFGNVRYSIGLRNIVSSNIINSTSKAPYHFEQYMKEVKTNALTVSLGVIYQFRLKN
ncbi:MAG: PorT family protein [Bacteroidetes bacterium]|nr:PorT family protein [Bacteroidota bacterium]